MFNRHRMAKRPDARQLANGWLGLATRIANGEFDSDLVPCGVADTRAYGAKIVKTLNSLLASMR
jgi:hypothetical protein